MMYVGVMLVWLVVAVKLPAVVRGWRDWSLRTYWLAILSLAVCLTLDRAPVYWAASQVTGIPNVAHGVSYGGAIMAGFLAQLFLLHSYDRRRYDRELPWRSAVLGVGFALYAVLFVVGPAQLPTDPDVPHDAAAGPALAAFRLVLAALVCSSATEVSWLAWRFSALAAHPPLSQGMRVVSLGCALVVVRVGIEYGAVPLWSAASGWEQSWSYSGALYGLNLLAMGGAALLAVGTVLPTASRRWDELKAAARHREACRDLAPLWEAMRAVTPALSNVRANTSWRAVLRRSSQLDLLYRMVAEIRDGYVVLRPYRQSWVEQELRDRAVAQGLRGVDADAYADAGSLRQAAQAHRRSHRTEEPAGQRPGGDAAPGSGSPSSGSLDAEVDYLLRVARWWTQARDPATAAVGSGAGATGRVSTGG